MELQIHRVGAHVPTMELLPECTEANVVLTTTESARPMAGGERGRLVEEEELREPAGLEEPRSPPAAKLEPAGDPAPPVVAPADAARLVVQTSAVAVDEATRRVGDQLAEWCHPILQRHVVSTLSPYTPAVAKPTGEKLIAENRRARRDFELIERVEAGVVLTGTEVKAARDGHVQLGQAYADVRDGEAWLIGASISEYAQGGPMGHQSDRDRKLLLHRGEIDSLYGKVREKGLTLVPTRMYFKDGRVKVEIALARGRERFDKRRVVAERDAQRDIERALKSRR